MLTRGKILAAVVSLLVVGAVASAWQNSDKDPQRLSVPGRTWKVEVSLPKFTIRQDSLSADGRSRKLTADIAGEGYMLSINIVPASTSRVSSKDLRDVAAERLKAGATTSGTDFKASEYKSTPIFEYITREIKSQPLNQKHFYAYISRDNIWIDIHLSKASYQQGDEKVFHTILNTLRFTDGAGAILPR